MDTITSPYIPSLVNVYSFYKKKIKVSYLFITLSLYIAWVIVSTHLNGTNYAIVYKMSKRFHKTIEKIWKKIYNEIRRIIYG
jgi:hypothetical protein